MNNTFNFKRFRQYAVKNYAENGRMYGIFALVVFVGLLGITLLVRSQGGPYHMLTDIYLTFGIAMMVFFLQTNTRSWRSRSGEVLDTMEPVSVFEKYLFTGLHTLVVFWIFFILLAVFWFSVFRADFDTPLPEIMDYLKRRNYCLFPISFHAIALFGFSFVRRNALWVYVLSALVFILLFSNVLWRFPGDDVVAGQFYLYLRPYFGSSDWTLFYYTSWLPGNVMSMLYLLIMCGFPLVFWISGYFKLREREIK